MYNAQAVVFSVSIILLLIIAPRLPTSRCWVSTYCFGKALWPHTFHRPSSAVDQHCSTPGHCSSCALHRGWRYNKKKKSDIVASFPGSTYSFALTNLVWTNEILGGTYQLGHGYQHQKYILHHYLLSLIPTLHSPLNWQSCLLTKKTCAWHWKARLV